MEEITTAAAKEEKDDIEDLSTPGKGVSRRWLLTANGTADWSITKYMFNADSMDYLVGQREKAPTTGTIHVHAYVVWKNKKTFNGVKLWAEAVFPVKPNIRCCKGNEKQCKDYVTKEESRSAGPWEFGKYDEFRGVQGKRTDLDTIKQHFLAGGKMREIVMNYTPAFVQWNKALYAMQLELAPLPPVQRTVKVVVLYGVTGTGKTHRVSMKYPDGFKVNPGRDPWGNYNGEKVIIFDEFEDKKWTIQQMNMFLDKWRCLLDARYHNKYAEWNLVVILSNTDPQDWYGNETNAQLRMSLWRRIGLKEGGNGVTVEVKNQEQVVPLPDWETAQVVDVSGVATVTLAPQQVERTQTVPPGPNEEMDQDVARMLREQREREHEEEEAEAPPLKRTKRSTNIVISDDD
nr:MAG: replication associated protein [Cressdnaviricota sp.]